jgi:hypothetical protein
VTTLAEDRDSWKAGGIIRRDFRHTHDGPEVPRHRRRRTKAERRGCHGKAGRAHTTVLVERSYCSVAVCSRCGKNVEYTWKRWFR